MGEDSTHMLSGSQICWAVSLGTGNAPSLLSVRSSSDVEEFTVVGEEGVVDGGGEDSLAAREGGMG